MNTLERLNKISAKAQRIAEAENNEQLKKLETIEYYKNAIKSLSPRLTELIKIGDALLENSILFGKRKEATIGYDEEFITNGITHKLGFYFKYSKDNSPLIGIGIKGGGCCGNDLAVNEEGDMVVKIDPHFHSYMYFGYNDYCNKCKQFLKDFDEFEKRVYEYVDNL